MAKRLIFSQLLQLGELCLGFLQDGNVRVGIFPKREEILVRRAGSGGVAGHAVCASETEVSQRANRLVSNDAGMVQNLLKLTRRWGRLLLQQIRGAPQVNRIESKGEGGVRIPQLVRLTC